MLHNIPAELQRLPQWVVADMSLGPDGKPKKIPLNPRTMQRADVTDPSTWGTFNEAKQSGGRIGFVLSRDDPYSIIDLDAPESSEQAERHTAVLGATASYAEYSQSRNGIHIIVRGRIPHGCRRDRVEVYSDTRYMICTGDVFRASPINEEQELCDTLFREMAATLREVELTECPQTMEDDALVDMALNASNGAKALKLAKGEWQGDYPSQSEADFAFMSILAFYSKANEQCRRLFRESALGQRDKAQRDKYLNYMLGKIRAKQPLEQDFSLLLKQAYEVANRSETVTSPENPQTRKGPPAHPGRAAIQGAGHNGSTPPATGPDERGSAAGAGEGMGRGEGGSLPYPPGLFGDIARYIHSSAIRPVKDIAILAALAAGAGVCGRSYNISGTGLNLYFILLARTGTGKEGIANGIGQLFAATRQVVPMADQFVGPGAFASGQALIRVLDERPCFVSVLGEIGLTLQSICDPKASDHGKMFKKILLDVYGKSGFQQILRPSVYSDKEKNTKMVQAPAVSLIGESTAETFYDKIGPEHIAEGLISRFIVWEYPGDRPAINPNAFAPPDDKLVNAFADIVSTALTTQANTSCLTVPMDEQAQSMLSDFNLYADSQINATNNDVERHLWNRAHLKALKIGALLAVGKDHQNPKVDAECAQWAVEFVQREVNALLAKFKDGDIGSGEGKQEADLKRFIKAYLGMPTESKLKYKVPALLAAETGPMVGYDFLRRRAGMTASFRNDRRGSSVALDKLLEGLVTSGQLTRLGASKAEELYQTTIPVYMLAAGW